MSEAIINNYTFVVIELDKLPKCILILSNISRRGFEHALNAYHENEDPDKVLVLFGIDPAYEAKAQYIEIPEVENGSTT